MTVWPTRCSQRTHHQRLQVRSAASAWLQDSFVRKTLASRKNRQRDCVVAKSTIHPPVSIIKPSIITSRLSTGLACSSDLESSSSQKLFHPVRAKRCPLPIRLKKRICQKKSRVPLVTSKWDTCVMFPIIWFLNATPIGFCCRPLEMSSMLSLRVFDQSTGIW